MIVPEDTLASDIIILLKPLPLSKKLREELTTQLIIYLVERDHKITAHAYEAGRASA